jgi:hypothetical protein
MSLETKGTIKWDPDVKPSEPQYMIEAKQLGICAEGSGNLDQMMDELTERIRREISQEFGIAFCDVQMVKYSVTLTFDVSAPVNRTLDQFECEIIAGDGSARAPLEKVMAAAGKIMDISEKTGKPALTILKESKAKIDSEKKKKKGKEAPV